MTIIAYFIIGLMSFISILVIWRFSSQRWSLPCPPWLSWLVELDNPFARAHKASLIIEYLALEPGMKIIDIGCGPGRVTIPLAQSQSGSEITAMDIQPEMLNKVKEKAKAYTIDNIRYLNAGIGEGKLPHNYYDRALLVAVLGEIPGQKKALQETFDALKAGGIVSITETLFDPHYQSKNKIITLAQQTGFKIGNIIGNRIAFTIHLRKP